MPYLFFCLPSTMMATSRPYQPSSSYSLQHSSPLEALCRRRKISQPVRHRQSSPCSHQQSLKTRPPYPLRKSLHLGWKIENEGFSNGTEEQSFIAHFKLLMSFACTCTAITSVHRFLIFTFKAPGVHLTLPPFDIVVGYR